MLKISDFGISRIIDKEPYQTSDQVGTPAYWSPEVEMNKSYDLKSDVWFVNKRKKYLK